MNLEQRLKKLELKKSIDREAVIFFELYNKTDNPTEEMKDKYWKYTFSSMTLEELVEGSRHIGGPDEHERTGR